jgi:hypothetical protein
MSHLNFFKPYNGASDNHENHLTRAFLVMMKYSKTIHETFINYIYSELTTELIEIEGIENLINQETKFETQKGSLPIANNYLSVLITNEQFEHSIEISPVERNAVYDGIVDYNGELVLFIETKPHHANVWENQLSPATKDIPIEAELISKPIILEWKKIISNLHEINENENTQSFEQLLIADFFNLVSESFDYLNPYDEFAKCHSPYLANRKIESMLFDLCIEPDRVSVHSGWGYYIQLDYLDIRKLGFILQYDKQGNWTGLSIDADFGSTVSQARSFYRRNIDFSTIVKLEGWDAYNNFHLAFKNQNLVFLGSLENNVKEYFDYYSDLSQTWNRIKQIKKSDLSSWLQDLKEKGFVKLDLAKQKEIDEKIMGKGYTTVNLCPSLYLEHFISRDSLINLEIEGGLKQYVQNKITEIIKLIDEDPKNLIK